MSTITVFPRYGRNTAAFAGLPSFGEVASRDQKDHQDYSEYDQRCPHQRLISKPCLVCMRIGDATCAKCFDFGARMDYADDLAKLYGVKTAKACECVTNPTDRAR